MLADASSTGIRLVIAEQGKVFRFRSELSLGRGSWIAVLIAYALGGVILFALVQFLIHFQRFESDADRADLLAQDVVAFDQLLIDLGPGITREAMASAIGRFDASYAGDATARTGLADGPRTRQAAAELLALHQEGASPARIRDHAEELADAEALEASAATERAERSKLAVNVYAVLLGIAVTLCVFGGGLLFLRRSRHLERLLSERAAELDEVDASRRLFFAKASHELRTPVTAIKGEAEVALADAEDLDAVRQALRHICAHVNFLNHRIEEMIGIARTSDGKLHLDASRLDMRDVTEGAVEDARAFAASVDVVLELTLPSDPVEVIGDATWLKRALLAVIENALKFSPMGGSVNVTLAKRDGLAEVTVADRGPGVMPEELPLVFDAYYQTDVGKARGGSGLGLAMTRWVAEQHGGRAFARNIGSWRRPDGCAVTVAVKLGQAA